MTPWLLFLYILAAGAGLLTVFVASAVALLTLRGWLAPDEPAGPPK